MNNFPYKDLIDELFADIIRTNEEREIFDQLYQVVELKKGQVFLDEADPWYKFGILIKGAVFSYTINDEGHKSVSDFYYYPDYAYLVDYESYITQSPISMSFECYEESVILNFDGLKFEKLIHHFPGILENRLAFAEQSYVKSRIIIKILQATTAEQKLRELFNVTPRIFKIFPYSYIASYLGIHRNTYRRALNKLNL
jgi:CRP-like cAMP-binding protein